ncbi:MAG: hypothetical protein INH34_12885, partial [Phycisphaerales bacterium]|nr:hypothetical protein [Phycisphaerales bacterium]
MTAKQKVQTMRTVQKARKAKKARPVQGALPFRSWGGARKGAGRKPKGTV